VESLSSYARQFLERMEKPDVDLIQVLVRQLPLNKKPLHATRVQLLQPPQKFTITFDCSLAVLEKRIVAFVVN